MKTPVFTGSSVAIVTPFHDGKIDFSKLSELIEIQIASGTAAITICGTTGESSTMSLEEHMEAVDFCVKTVNHRIKVIAGAGSNDTMAAVMLSQEAERSGADAVLSVTPYYNKTTQRGLISHYTYIADRINIPMILYNVPSRTGLSISFDTYKELAKHPMINGTKEASSNFSVIGSTIAACGDDMHVWSGNDDETVPMMSIGAKGVISVVANIMPSLMAELTSSCAKGDYAHAAKLHLKHLDFMGKLFIEVNPIPVKTAMNLLGMNVGEPRLPLCAMEQQNLDKLQTAMRNIGLLK